jgi:glucan 1,3-beta-glucosidase
MRFSSLLTLCVAATVRAFWMEEVAHQGISAYNPDPNYKVFRNVKEFGAKGDGGERETLSADARGLIWSADVGS